MSRFKVMSYLISMKELESDLAPYSPISFFLFFAKYKMN